MKSYFQNISLEEYAQLKEAVFNVSILIAGADGKIDEEEKEWAEKITHIREYSGPEVLRAFYADLGENFEEHLEARIKELPEDVEERNVELAEALRNLNPILAKLPQTVGASYYESLTSLAKHIAKASGGIMRIWAISSEEANWIELPMITPISFPEIEE
ncbi:hypothetical protein [Portibacter lacus]|uniref:Tellurite resistance protein TerB n=1 Tax=Portibacter lacus TaxID=1099794 RepID=A0AA37STQ9_9BACT|nr:hypothetical protein [Portibacter lacus]GLR20077.1 hypothetical protein GCM10007940_46930 [Portibacter lacus]